MAKIIFPQWLQRDRSWKRFSLITQGLQCFILDNVYCEFFWSCCIKVILWLLQMNMTSASCYFLVTHNPTHFPKKVTRAFHKFSMTRHDHPPLRARRDGTEVNKGCAWVLLPRFMCTKVFSTLLSYDTFTRALLHNYLYSASNTSFLCLGTGLPPIYSLKLRIIKKPLAFSLCNDTT